MVQHRRRRICTLTFECSAVLSSILNGSSGMCGQSFERLELEGSSATKPDYIRKGTFEFPGGLAPAPRPADLKVGAEIHHD